MNHQEQIKNTLKKIVDHKNFNFDDIIFDSIIPYHQKYQKINIYNKGIKEPFQKIWLKTPKVRVSTTFSLNLEQIKKACPLYVNFDKFDEEYKKFYEFVAKLENKMEDHVKSNLKEDITFRSSISNTNYPQMSLQMPFIKKNNNIEFMFQIYNHRNKKINLKSLEGNAYISAFIELTDIWIDGQKFGYNWNILQMKIYPQLEFTRCLFIDEEEEIIVINEENECYHCMYCPNYHATTTYNNILPPAPFSAQPIHSCPPPPPLCPPPKLLSNSKDEIKSVVHRFIPCELDLLNAKNKLKKISDDKKIENQIDEFKKNHKKIK